MIDIKELRFGNYVRLTEPSGITSNMIVGGIMPKEISLWFLHNVSSGDKVEVLNGIAIRDWQHEDGFAINPIPLTKELLLKSGFECKYDFLPNVTNESLSIICHGMTIDVFKGKEGWFIHVDDDSSMNVGYARGVQYLHQLQNLYFAFVGSEMEINL